MFDSAWRKIERAKQHIADLQRTFDAFVQRNPHEFLTENDPQTGALTIQVRLREPIPHDLPLILGDAVHNLRTALDHAMWELIEIDCGTQDRSTAFPFSKNRKDYEAACHGIKTPRADTKKFFLALAACPSGAGEKLYGLHLLDNAEKHKMLTPVVGVASVRHLEVIGSNGEVFMTLADIGFCMDPSGTARIAGMGPGLTVKFDQDADLSIGIFFGQVEFFETLPLIETLMDLAQAIDDTLVQLSAMVALRK